jgi:hypothetical protein
MEDHCCSGDSRRRDRRLRGPGAKRGFACVRSGRHADSRGPGMTEREWIEIEGQLVRSYQLLKEAVAGN